MVYTDGVHVVATTIEELHEFAYTKLNFPARWFQGLPEHKFPHYDTMTKGKKLQALKGGAIMVEGANQREKSKNLIRMFAIRKLQIET
jgi:hypothetical protein